MKRFVCINTSTNFKETIYNPFLQPFVKDNPGIKLNTITDDSLMFETRDNNGITVGVINRMYQYARCAVDMNADCIMCTCTSVSKATSHLKKMIPVPFFNIEEPTAKAAVDSGTKIGVLATLTSSPGIIIDAMQQYADSCNKKVEFITSIAEGAYEILSSGNRAEHDKIVNKALVELAKKVDTIIFSQISMSLLPHDDVGIPIFKLGPLALQHAKSILLG